MENRNTREPEFFWHNVGFRSKGDASSRLREASRGISLARRNNWWRYLLRNGEVSANRKNEPGDRGEKLLKSYIAGDRIIVYAGGYGAIGWGVVEEPRYALVGEGSVRDVFPRSLNRHRLKGISWKERTENLEDALPISGIRKIGVHLPIQTSERIQEQKARTLIGLLKSRFAPGSRQTDTDSDDPSIAQERAAGFQSDPKIRRAMEEYAMGRARKALEARGYDGFEETASYECYDYMCRKDGRLRYVEVKGTQTNGASVILTHNEIEHCNAHPDDSIFVLVHSIRVTNTGRLKLRNGTLLIREPWVLITQDLKPIQYWWAVR